jgi:hypothetical protein
MGRRLRSTINDQKLILSIFARGNSSRQKIYTANLDGKLKKEQGRKDPALLPGLI